MRAFSAADAISPAVQRTKIFLFESFEWGTFLKLCLVALITEGIGSNFSSSHRNQSTGTGPGNFSAFHFTPVAIAAMVAASLGVALLALFIAYLVTRLRFAFFHCLVTNTKLVRPGWQIYREPAMRFFWLNVVVGFCFVLVLILIALPFAAGFWRLFHSIPPGGHPDFALLLALLLPLIPIFFLVIVVAILIDVVFRDWMLPHYALDNARAGEAWTAVWAHIKAEKGQFFFYALLRVVLPIIAMIAVFMIMIIPGLVFLGIVAFIEVGIHSAFAASTGGSAIAGVLVQVFVGVVSFGFALLASVCLGGPISTAIREYALLFYGGRYKALGDLLYPQVPTTVSTPYTPGA
jgi:hypothetical protein